MKWGFLGASTIASEWMVNAVRAVGDEVISIVSGDLTRARQFAAKHGIPHALDQDEQLTGLGLDAIYISSTNEKHEAQALLGAGMGCHVLCEKPLATNLAAARRIVRACRDAGVTLATNHHLRHNAAHRRIRDLLRTGAIGRPIAARVLHSVHLPEHLRGWRLDNPDAGGGVVLDIAVHNADSLAFLLGEYPDAVVAMTSNTGMARGLEDNAMSIWHFPSGLTALTHQGFNSPQASTRLEILGDAGAIEGEGVLTQAPGGKLVLRAGGKAEEQSLDTGNLYVRGLQEMKRAIDGQPSDVADGLAGLRSLEVAHAVLESARTGQRVEIRHES